MSATTQVDIKASIQARIDGKTKPVGALGKLEAIALQAGLIQQCTRPHITRPHIVVFAADHGIARTGLVNPYPQEVTAQMVLNFLKGGAAINVFCTLHQVALKIVDAGVNIDFAPTTGLIDAKLGYGTRNYLEAEAMTQEQYEAALQKGAAIVQEIAATGCNCIGFGEMGIGNTSAASLILSAITGIPVEECTGTGTGATDEQLLRKKQTLQQVFRRHIGTVTREPGAAAILRCFGGFEIAMMTGAFLEAARRHMVIVVDGFITTAALMLAQLINPSITDYCIFAHASGEQGHEKMLQFLQVQPLLQLGMRLGEGTGAALAIPLIQAAVHFLEEMASFETAGVASI